MSASGSQGRLAAWFGNRSAEGPIAARAAWAWLALVAVSLLVVASRRPDALSNAQFWAEDGAIWFRDAHELGWWQALLLPQNGYYQTISRLAAAVGQGAGLRHAPLLFNLIAIAFQILPVLLLFSRRGRLLVPHAGLRILVALLYLGQPYTREIHANVTNIQWHLALTALLTLCLRDWPRWHDKVLDTGIVALAGLSGPFCVLLFPVAALDFVRRRDRRSLVLAILLLLLSLLQASQAIPEMGITRAVAPLGASFEGLARIVGGHVVLAAVVGDAWQRIYETGWWQGDAAWPLLATTAGLLLLARGWVVGDRLVRAMILFAGLVLVAALVSPQITSTSEQWPVWTTPHTGGRYAFLPILAMYAALLAVCFRDPRRPLRLLAGATLGVVLLFAIPASWRLPPHADREFQRYASDYEAAAPGALVRIPINPGGWSMTLRKPARER